MAKAKTAKTSKGTPRSKGGAIAKTKTTAPSKAKESAAPSWELDLALLMTPAEAADLAEERRPRINDARTCDRQTDREPSALNQRWRQVGWTGVAEETEPDDVPRAKAKVIGRLLTTLVDDASAGRLSVSDLVDAFALTCRMVDNLCAHISERHFGCHAPAPFPRSHDVYFTNPAWCHGADPTFAATRNLVLDALSVGGLKVPTEAGVRAADRIRLAANGLAGIDMPIKARAARLECLIEALESRYTDSETTDEQHADTALAYYHFRFYADQPNPLQWHKYCVEFLEAKRAGRGFREAGERLFKAMGYPKVDWKNFDDARKARRKEQNKRAEAAVAARTDQGVCGGFVVR